MWPVAAPPVWAACIQKKLSNRDDRHATPTPSAPGQTTVALEAAVDCLRTHLRGSGRLGGLGHLVAPPSPSATASTRGCPAHHHHRAGTYVLDHHHPATDPAPSPPTRSPNTNPSAASRSITTAGRRTTAD